MEKAIILESHNDYDIISFSEPTVTTEVYGKMVVYPQYFDTCGINQFNFFILGIQAIIVGFIYIFIWNYTLMSKVFFIDNVNFMLLILNYYYILKYDKYITQIAYLEKILFFGSVFVVNYFVPINHILCYLLLIPYITNYIIINTYFNNIVSGIKKKLLILLHIIISYQIAKILKCICKRVFEINTTIDYRDIYPLIDNEYKFAKNFITSMLFAYLLRYIEMKNTILYMFVQRYYFRQYIDQPLLHEYKDDREFVINFINRHQWKELENPLVMHRVLAYYVQNKKTDRLINTVKHRSDILMKKIVFVLTILSMTDNKYVAIFSYLFYVNPLFYYLIRCVIVITFLIISMFSQENILLVMCCGAVDFLFSNRLGYSLVADACNTIHSTIKHVYITSLANIRKNE